jgi:hypothetical protein
MNYEKTNERIRNREKERPRLAVNVGQVVHQ